ncbi:hypothetical protein PGT21_020190 [Puccinia graminis f. sp. tritici]|uniref:Uncharacterized protein n=1 Tax=Puccinia graminis f. sp. tritici TaxID=56615 RepID=A0A5B0QUM1_PUCGR|nr:hypothetical protein PGT21_020190 [Puccinia graminis f. sp. tritici]
MRFLIMSSVGLELVVNKPSIVPRRVLWSRSVPLLPKSRIKSDFRLSLIAIESSGIRGGLSLLLSDMTMQCQV